MVRLVLEDQRDLAVQLRHADRQGQLVPACPLHLAVPAAQPLLADLLDQLHRARQCYPAARPALAVLAHLAVRQGQRALEGRLGLRGPEDLGAQQEGHCIPQSPSIAMTAEMIRYRCIGRTPVARSADCAEPSNAVKTLQVALSGP